MMKLQLNLLKDGLVAPKYYPLNYDSGGKNVMFVSW